MGLFISKQKNRRRFTSFVLDSFDVNPRYLAEFDLSRQMLGSRPRPENVSFEQWKATTTSRVAVDFTSTAIKQQRHWTYGAKKADKQQKYSNVEHVITSSRQSNWDGSMIEPFAFSHNPALMPGSQELDFLCPTIRH